jgi:RNA recognition motif-containing protein
MRIFAGGLSQEISEEDLQQAFAEFGKVESVKIIMDHYSGKSKGYGFIEMPDTDEAKAAIEGLNDKEIKGTKVNVSEARPRAERRGHKGGRGGPGSNRGGFHGGGYHGDKGKYGGSRSGRGGNR